MWRKGILSISLFQGAVERFDIDKDGFIDWDEFLALMMEVRSSYYKSLFKMYDLNKDNQIDKSEMETIVAQIKARGEAEKGKKMEELFNIMLKNFDDDGDGKINIFEFTNAIKSLKF